MAKLPDNRRPYDPAKAARERAAGQEKPVQPLTAHQRAGKRHLHRPTDDKPEGSE